MRQAKVNWQNEDNKVQLLLNLTNITNYVTIGTNLRVYIEQYSLSCKG